MRTSYFEDGSREHLSFAASGADQLPDSGSVQSVHVFRHALILTAICLLTFFAGLGRSAIGDSDEAFYAQSAREMIQSGDWITPHYNFEPRFQKPILFYWLVAISYLLAGVSEAAARFPSALTGLGISLLTCLCGRRWIGPRAGLLAGAIVATSFGYFTIARSALPDMPLAFFITLATWSLFEGLTCRSEAPAPRAGVAASTRWLVLTAAAMALGLLTKGPVGVALPVLLVIVARAGACRPVGWLPDRSGWFGASWRDIGISLAVFAAIALPWYLAMVLTHGPAYLERFFVDENLERFATERYNEPRPVWFYVPILLGGLAPWSPLLFMWIPSAVRVLRREQRLSELEWRLLSWGLVPVLFYTLSIGKQPRYILPVLPPLALLAARTLVTRIERARAAGKRDTALVAATTVSAVILLVLAVLLHRARPLLFALSPVSGQVGTLVIVAAGIGLTAVAWLGRQTWLPTVLTTAAIATLLSLHYSVYSAAGLEPVQRMARMLSEARSNGEASGTYRVFVRNLIFYTGIRQNDLVDEREAAEFLSRSEKVFCVMPADLLQSLERSHQLQLRRLGAVLYFNPSGVRVRTLLSPEPERDLETVVLVTNQ